MNKYLLFIVGQKQVKIQRFPTVCIATLFPRFALKRLSHALLVKLISDFSY